MKPGWTGPSPFSPDICVKTKVKTRVSFGLSTSITDLWETFETTRTFSGIDTESLLRFANDPPMTASTLWFSLGRWRRWLNLAWNAVLNAGTWEEQTRQQGTYSNCPLLVDHFTNVSTKGSHSAKYTLVQDGGSQAPIRLFKKPCCNLLLSLPH